MKVVLFYHSFVSCWNHGNAHFLRGIARELARLGHAVTVYEPEDGWSRQNAIANGGADILAEAASLVPGVASQRYRAHDLDALAAATDQADLVIVHEWTSPDVVAAIGRQRRAGAGFTLLFHDTHHRALTARDDIDALDLDGYDGVLAFGEVLRHIYLRAGWGRRVFTWHEAADTALFRPMPAVRKDVDLLWIGNWGDGERTRELDTYLIRPIARREARTRICGVRYPDDLRRRLLAHGVEFSGWLPNHRAPMAYARARATIHIPRRPYVEALPGIPTIRMFEALACGVPLISAPWTDSEGLFPPGAYMAVRDEDEATAALSAVLNDTVLARQLSGTGLSAIAARHTCAHRVQELLAIVDEIDHADAPTRAAHTSDILLDTP